MVEWSLKILDSSQEKRRQQEIGGICLNLGAIVCEVKRMKIKLLRRKRIVRSLKCGEKKGDDPAQEAWEVGGGRRDPQSGFVFS